MDLYHVTFHSKPLTLSVEGKPIHTEIRTAGGRCTMSDVSTVAATGPTTPPSAGSFKVKHELQSTADVLDTHSLTLTEVTEIMGEVMY